MLRRFNNYGDALKFGAKFASDNNCYVYCNTVYMRDGSTTAIITTGSSLHHMRDIGHYNSCSSIGSWYFGNTGVMEDSPQGQKLLALQDEPALPNRGEYWYALVASYTSGYTHEAILAIAANIEKNNTSVWHESAIYSGNVDKCQCGSCVKKRKAA